MNKITPVQLWDEFVRGNDLAFAQVVQHLTPMVFAFVLGKTGDILLSEDIVQDTWLKSFERRDKVHNVRAYLFTVAKNLMLDHIRKTDGKVFQSNEEISAAISPQVEQDIEKKELDSELEMLLKEPDYSIWKFHSAGFNNDEIAKKLKLSRKTVANRKSLVKNKLKKLWK
ncbi:MAG: sigma-70 family RNA polymerase sigma factor [Bacteroidota bacterium]